MILSGKDRLLGGLGGKSCKTSTVDLLVEVQLVTDPSITYSKENASGALTVYKWVAGSCHSC